MSRPSPANKKLPETLSFLILKHYEKKGIIKGWTREQFNRLCQLSSCLPEEIAALCCIGPKTLQACLRKNNFPAPVSLHLEIIQAVVIEAQCGKPWERIIPIEFLAKKILSGKTPEKKQQPVTERKENTMHYRNGREAKNGDKIVQLGGMSGGEITAFGVLHSATPGNDYCNGGIAPLTFNVGACMCDCLHVDDLASILSEKGLDKRKPKQTATTEVAPDTSAQQANPYPTADNSAQAAQSEAAPEWAQSAPQTETNDKTDTQG